MRRTRVLARNDMTPEKFTAILSKQVQPAGTGVPQLNTFDISSSSFGFLRFFNVLCFLNLLILDHFTGLNCLKLRPSLQ